MDNLLIGCEYIDFFIQMYMKWRNDDGSTSSIQKLIIARLPRFEKLASPQFNLYIETHTMTQWYVCHNCQKTNIIRSDEGKQKFFVFYTC